MPDQDIHADLLPAPPADAAMNPVRTGANGPPVLDSNTSFAVHTCEGQPLILEHGSVVLAGAGFRPADAELSGYMVLGVRHVRG